MKIVRERENLVYENRYVAVYDDDVAFPSGEKGAYFRTQWKAPYGVAIVPVIGDEVILIRSYRYTEGAIVTEIPQGFGTDGSSPEADAVRELYEETGLRSKELTLLAVFGKAFQTYVYICCISKDQKPTMRSQENTESILDFCSLPLSGMSFEQLAEAGVVDPLTVSSVLMARDRAQSFPSRSG